MLVLRQLTRRFGTLNVHTTRSIESLSQEQLETLAEDLLDFIKIEELGDWLDEVKPT